MSSEARKDLLLDFSIASPSCYSNAAQSLTFQEECLEHKINSDSSFRHPLCPLILHFTLSYFDLGSSTLPLALLPISSRSPLEDEAAAV